MSKPWFLRKWEFWPPFAFYPPLVLYGCLVLLRYWLHPLRIVQTNPAFHFSGLTASKQSVLDEFTKSKDYSRYKQHFAKSIVVHASKPVQERKALAQKFVKGMSFPIIFKPDYGQRGLAVQLLHSQKELDVALSAMQVDYIIQEYYDYPHELGIFYVKFPGDKTGAVTGVTNKIIPTVTGNGKTTIKEFIDADPVLVLRRDTLYDENQYRLGYVVPAKRRLKLLHTGTHARGALFYDGKHLLSATATTKLQEISDLVPDFYIGRYDIKIDDMDSFRQQGTGFKIVELNGVDGESTQIYDPSNSLFDAYSILMKQINDTCKIASLLKSKHPKPSWADVRKEYKEFFGKLNQA